MKKVSLELGGKSPNIVLEDADMKATIPGAASAIFFNHGQCCCAGSRLYVQESAFDNVVQGIAERANKIHLGPGLDPQRTWGRSSLKSSSHACAAISNRVWPKARKRSPVAAAK